MLTLTQGFWATVCKTVRLCYRTVVVSACPVCLSVTLVYCGQTVGWINTKHGMQVGLGPGHIVLDGDPAPPPTKGGRAPPNYRPISVVAKWLDGSRYHLVGRRPHPHCGLSGAGSGEATWSERRERRTLTAELLDVDGEPVGVQRSLCCRRVAMRLQRRQSTWLNVPTRRVRRRLTGAGHRLRHHSTASSIQSNLIKKTVSSPHTDGSIVFARWRQCAPPSNTCFLRTTRVYTPNGISIG